MSPWKEIPPTTSVQSLSVDVPALGHILPMPNVYAPDWDDEPERPDGFAARRARLGRQAGSRRLGASLYELEPGQASWPYHWHHANEELLVVVRGRPSLRSGDGWRELDEGDVVAFPVGEAGAHQIANRSGDAVRFLVVSEMIAPEVSLYPDTGRVGAFGRAPGSADEGLEAILSLETAGSYWDGERPPAGG
jgi:uncharacterized cupin superfamily protein